MTCGVSGWFGTKVNILSFFLMVVLYVVCILSRDVADPVILAMLIASVLAIQDNLMWSLKTFMQIHNTMVSAARCMKLIEVPQERAVPATVRASAGYPLGGRNSWPEQGVVEFKNVSLRYRPTTEIVLHDLSFSINSGEKIGIVGRTGAGKSTICLAISRIVEIFEG
jgi:ABC-type multidrug transport system fused ATPase/permease subunit